MSDSLTSSFPVAASGASYAWTQAAGPTVTLSSVSAAAPTFSAPAPAAASQTVILGLTVTDDGGAVSAQSTVTVTINPAVVQVRDGGAWMPGKFATRVGGVWL